MSLLSQPVSIGNVIDAEAFVRHVVKKAPGILASLTPDQLDDLISEGLVILTELHAKYDPARDKGAQVAGTKGFYGYALFLLPKKLNDAWHRSQPHHVMRTREDGSRGYEYLLNHTSFDRLLEGTQKSAAHGDLNVQHLRQTGNYVPVPIQIKEAA